MVNLCSDIKRQQRTWMEPRHPCCHDAATPANSYRCDVLAAAQGLRLGRPDHAANCTRDDAMTYVDGFVAAVPTANREKFKRHAEEAADVFKENGALKVVECWGDDVPEGQVTSFPMAVKRQPDETVIFSWIVWPSREVRDKGMKALMADPRMQPDTNPMPFDSKRMIFGGFVPIVEK